MKVSHHYASQLQDLVSKVKPHVLTGMRTRLVNQSLATQFQLPESWWQNNTMVDTLRDPASVLSANAVAQKYGGHQFGQWNPYLGDGRGLLLAEVEDEHGQRFDLHLKGAGQTPYSRGADGRAVLRSTLREYLGSEALHHLGIPSSRSLCLFDSNATVFRETPESGAMMIRMAPSHIRFGHFEFYFHNQDQAKLDALFDFTMTHFFPEAKSAANPHAALLTSVTLRTARMVALWQAHGFVHGVMNTDNMSIHGITFDYGPYAFMDHYEPSAVFNHSDHSGRYAFDRQPGIALWNLNALAHAFSGHCTIDELRAALSQFEPTFIDQYQQIMCARMGFTTVTQTSLTLLNQWLDMLHQQQRDFSKSFRLLALASMDEESPSLRDHFLDRDGFDNWWQGYRQAYLAQDDALDDHGRRAALCALNPAVIARTHLLQQAIDAASEGDYSLAEALLDAFANPFDSRFDDHPFGQPPKEAASMSLSCSS